jgi:diaminopropionate ammonia-lyase
METPGRLKLFCNPRARRPSADAPDTSWASPEALRTVRRFHQTLPGYQPTPLVALNQLARRLGLGGIWIKDESRRFGLKAFKALGASYAVCAVLAEQLGLAPPLNFAAFRQPEIRRRLSNITLLAASDGNHGLAVAWMAAQLGCRSRILLPRDAAACRTRAIELMEGEAIRVDGNYDAAVDRAAREADQPGALLIQDTGRQGYETVPLWVMQGYLTLFEEAFDQMSGFLPSHVFVPCGVGSLAGSLQAYLVERYGGQRPRLIVIEAAAADCYYRSMAAGGASIIAVEGNLETRMAGLACGVPSHLGWPLLRRFADGFASCPDAIATDGMRHLAFPLPEDPPVESGECGAVTLGCLQHLLQVERGKGEQVPLELGPAARILLISTEGATNPDSYRGMLGEGVDRSLLGD